MKKLISRLLILAILIPLAVIPAWEAEAAEPQVLLAEEQITLPAVRDLFEAAFLQAEIVEDRYILITDDGFKSALALDTERKLIGLLSLWRMRADPTDEQKLDFINGLNVDLILVRFCRPEPDLLYCDYQFSYEGGITEYAIINNYRLFKRVVEEAVTTRDPEGMLE